MSTFIYSQILEDKLHRYDPKVLDRLYAFRNERIFNCHLTWIVSQYNFNPNNLVPRAEAMKQIDDQMQFHKFSLPAYYFHTEVSQGTARFYCRVIVEAKDEQTALSYFDGVENIAILA